MKTQTQYFLMWICLIIHLQGITQPEGYSKGVIIENNVGKVIGVMKMADTSHVLEGTILKEYEFDGLGNCIRKKFLSPLIDVVSKSTEYQMGYDEQNRVIEEMKISKCEALTEGDRDFIAMFGEDVDSIFTRYHYENNQLARRERYNLSNSDTLIRTYFYEDSLVVQKDQYSVANRGRLHRGNYVIRYYYDELDRKIREEKQYATSDLFSVKEFEYVDSSERLMLEKSFNSIYWSTIRDGYGGEEHQLRQDSLNGRMIEYIYNGYNELIKKLVYSNLADLSQVRTIEINNSDQASRRSKMSGNIEEGILLKDEELKEFNNQGMLIREKVFLRGKLKYTCVYEIIN